MWREPDRRLWRHFWSTAAELPPGPAASERILPAASDLVAATPSTRQLLSHRDLKPENCLLTQDNTLVILDWDESGPTSPRAEAVEAAFRWSWTGDRPDPTAAAQFLHSYDTAPAAVTPVRGTIGPIDWANSISAAASWAELQATRSLTDLDDTDARDAAVEAVDGCARLLANTDTWSTAINTAYRDHS